MDDREWIINELMSAYDVTRFSASNAVKKAIADGVKIDDVEVASEHIYATQKYWG